MASQQMIVNLFAKVLIVFVQVFEHTGLRVQVCDRLPNLGDALLRQYT